MLPKLQKIQILHKKTIGYIWLHKSIRDGAQTINRRSFGSSVRKYKFKLNKLGSDRLYAIIAKEKGWQIDDCFFVEDHLDEIGLQSYGFY